MAVFKCKMCGGTLEINEGMTICECEYCGTMQTLPRIDNEVVSNLFNRANTLRIKSEFDKAEEIYNKIIEIDNTQAEAYWGIILCKYGIEYVEDPATFKRVPTCHRTSFDAITADADYNQALNYADLSQKAIYEAEAKVIDELQKDILKIVNNEEPFDVFICYKETDENGKRTQDSVIANDIYHQLTQERFRVFYAAITLEDKLGQEYEPYIFSALNSAKVLLAIGTKPEYFNAVWVKNEWSRFLKIIKSDRSKLLIPCYKDMDAYELPEEFSHLQSQNISKIGFINDIVRGIKKVISIDETHKTVIKETVVPSVNYNIAPLVKRMFMFIEESDWENAYKYSERILDIEPECAEAYFGKFMMELQINHKEQLLQKEEVIFEDNSNYKKAVRFANGDLKDELLEYPKLRKYNIYCREMERAVTEAEYIDVSKKFKEISGYRDSNELFNECLEKSITLQKEKIYINAYNKMSIANDEESLKIIAEDFRSISGYKEADRFFNECLEKAEIINKEKIYIQAMDFYNQHLYEKSIELFKTIRNYKNSEKLINSCYEIADRYSIEQDVQLLNKALKIYSCNVENEKPEYRLSQKIENCKIKLQDIEEAKNLKLRKAEEIIKGKNIELLTIEKNKKMKNMVIVLIIFFIFLLMQSWFSIIFVAILVLYYLKFADIKNRIEEYKEAEWKKEVKFYNEDINGVVLDIVSEGDIIFKDDVIVTVVDKKGKKMSVHSLQDGLVTKVYLNINDTIYSKQSVALVHIFE